MDLPKGTRIKLYLKNGYFYKGTVDSTSEYFLTIIDQKTEKKHGLALSEIRDYEVLE